jgi:hypothetical protein
MSTNHTQVQRPAHGNNAKVEAMIARNRGKGLAAEPTTTVAGSRMPPLPRWPNTDRGVPNSLLRSASFAAIAKGPRRKLERENISSHNNITISYTGAQLDQSDLDVWMTVLHLARTQSIGQVYNITVCELLLLLQLTDTGANRKTLISRLSRLNTCRLKIQFGGVMQYEGSLIKEIYRDEHSRQFITRLNPDLHNLFAKDQFTQIQWDVRKTLKGHYLAQWLHGYYSSHAAPYPLKIETIHKLSGSKTTDLSKFRQLLHKALNALALASTKHGKPFSYCIAGKKVYVVKTPSNTQQRHLSKHQDEKNAVTVGRKCRRSKC